jgi:hypothetical protein
MEKPIISMKTVMNNKKVEDFFMIKKRKPQINLWLVAKGYF